MRAHTVPQGIAWGKLDDLWPSSIILNFPGNPIIATFAQHDRIHAIRGCAVREMGSNGSAAWNRRKSRSGIVSITHLTKVKGKKSQNFKALAGLA